MSDELLNVAEILNYCERAVETLRKMQQRCLDRATEMDFAAYAWFRQEERIYGYEIPNTIRAILNERKGGANADRKHRNTDETES